MNAPTALGAVLLSFGRGRTPECGRPPGRTAVAGAHGRTSFEGSRA